MRRAALLACGVAIVALVTAGCGGPASGSDAHKLRRVHTHTSTTPAAPKRRPAATPPSAAEIVSAAQLTGGKPGYQARLRIRIRAPQFGGDPATAVGSGSFDPASNTGTLNLEVNPPGLLSLIGPLPTRVIIVGDALYVRVPPHVSGLGLVSSTTKWLEGSVSGLGLSDSVDPAHVLSDTARDATQTVPGQRARVAIDPATGLIRSFVLAFYDPILQAHIRVALRFTGFAAVSPAQAPPAAEAGDLAAALQHLGA